MDVSKLIKSTCLYWVGAFIFFQFACKSPKAHTLINIRHTDSISDFQEIDNRSKIFVYGAHVISINKEACYTTYLACQDTLEIFNLNHGKIVQKIKLNQNATAIASKDSVIYIFYAHTNFFQCYTLTDSVKGAYKIGALKSLPIFNDSIFISTFGNTPIHIINNHTFLVPYRVKNETHNLIDTFSYLFIKPLDSMGTFKVGAYPKESEYDYLFKSITEYDYNNNIFIYGFQKSNIIHLANLKKMQEEIITLDKLKTVDFPKDKLRNITYLRKYISQNDKISKIIADKNSNLYIIVKHNEKNKFKYRIYYYIKNEKELTHIDIDFTVYSDMAFIKNNHLYIPNEKNCYSIFSVDTAFLQKQ